MANAVSGVVCALLACTLLAGTDLVNSSESDLHDMSLSRITINSRLHCISPIILQTTIAIYIYIAI